jgi:hypothetical protein
LTQPKFSNHTEFQMRLSRLKIRTVVLGCWFCVPLATGIMAQNLETDLQERAQYLLPPQLPAAQELFNPMSGFYTSVAQEQPGPKNPPCPNCDLDLNFQPLNPAYSDAAALPGTPANEYGRMSWHSLEPNEGQYDFSIIDNVLGPCPPPEGRTLCLPQGARFGFRIMAMNPQVKSDTNVTTGSDGYPVYSDVPSYLENGWNGRAHGWLLPVDPSDLTQGHYFIPDWNDPYFIDRIWALLSALGQKYDNDPRVGWIDIGLYGSWGEWHTGGLPDTQDYTGGAIPYASSDPYFDINTQAYLANTGTAGAYEVGTEASKTAIIWAHIRAFPDRQLVMLTDDGNAVCTAMHANTQVPVGLRRDSLGSDAGWNWHFPLDPTSDCTSEADQNLIADRWEKAPFTVEPFGNGSSPTFPCQSFETDPKTGLLEMNEQVQQFHLAAVKNGAFCSGTWADLTPSEQSAVWSAGLQSGYRYAPTEIYIPAFTKPSTRPSISIHTHWANTGVTPAYDRWNVEFSLWDCRSGSSAPRHEVTSFISTVDLRKVLPTPLYVHSDSFALPNNLEAGRYELRMRVIDPEAYLNPMQLALQNGTPDGYYLLGHVQIPDFRRH